MQVSAQGAGLMGMTRVGLAAPGKHKRACEAAVLPVSEHLSLWLPCCTIPGSK